ncbi:MAG TPA: hypothetical protein VET24_13410 [Actinomycetota bacterium]|nr:hypothetical protein [Actinomycetota bacterium]
MVRGEERAAYVEGGMSTSSIAADVGCSRATVEKYLAACGIKARCHQAGVDNLLYEVAIHFEGVRARFRLPTHS